MRRILSIIAIIAICAVVATLGGVSPAADIVERGAESSDAGGRVLSRSSTVGDERWRSSRVAPESRPQGQSKLSLQHDLLTDATDGRLDRYTLLEAALIAGGVDSPETLRARQDQLRRTMLELAAESSASIPPERRAVALFDAMHRRLLRGVYRAEVTELDRTLETGDFNCVTATLLYRYLCDQHKIVATPLATPGHVFCRLELDEPVEVQTTCREWFHQMRSQAPAKEPAAPRALTDVELVAKVFYNRGVEALERNDYAEAQRVLRIALRLDPADEQARNNLAAGLNNWALDLSERGDFSGAAARLDECRAVDSTFTPLLANDVHLRQRWAAALCGQGRWTDALAVLEQAQSRAPSEPRFAEQTRAVRSLWAQSLAAGGQAEQALQIAKQATTSPVGAKRLSTVAPEVHRLIAAGKKDEAARTLATALDAPLDHGPTATPGH